MTDSREDKPAPSRRRSIKERIAEGERQMIICVAAICNSGTLVIGAADRMITSGDVQYEPSVQKIWTFRPAVSNVVMMISGDVGIHSHFWPETYAALRKKLEAEPGHVWKVKEVASLFLDQISGFHATLAERELLSPLGLTLSSLLSRKADIAPEMAKQLADKIQRYPLPDVSAMFVGQDTASCHIYVVEDGELSCKDAVSFSATGAGFWHANSHFMFARHSRFETGPRTLLRVYAAKKRAEVAPHVGRETDMFTIASDGDYTPLPFDLVVKIDQLYRAYVAGIEATGNAIEQQAEALIQQLKDEEDAAKAQPIKPAEVPQPETAAQTEEVKPKPSKARKKPA